MGKKKQTQTEVAPVSHVPPVEVNNNQTPNKYVVLRDGFRVEDAEYDTPDDPVAISTLEFWTKVSQNHSCGEKTEIVQYDPKKHRVW
jgi:hypothetical protein